MTEAAEYMDRVGDALGGEFVNGRLRLALDISSVTEAQIQKKKFVQQQKHLRQIKREINQDMRYIRDAYKDASADVQPSSVSIFAGLFGKRGISKSDVAQQRRDLRQRRDNTLEPYNDAKLTIDDLLIQIDGAKLALTEYINDNK